MSFQQAEKVESLLRRAMSRSKAAFGDGPEDADSYRLQVQLLRTRNRRLEHALADAHDATEAVKAKLADHHRHEAELYRRLDDARTQSAFEIAWTGFSAEPTLDERLSALDVGDDRARRWLLTP